MLDLTWALAGPYGSLHLALLGAEVIKVETITALDAMRRGIYALSADHERSPTFNSINLNKLGLWLNLKHSEGLALFKELASISDVVVENFRPGVLQRMGLGYDILRELNPTIIVASSSAFGATGPESRRPGYASIFNAVSGLGHLTGYADGPPTEMRDFHRPQGGRLTCLRGPDGPVPPAADGTGAAHRPFVGGGYRLVGGTHGRRLWHDRRGVETTR